MRAVLGPPSQNLNIFLLTQSFHIWNAPDKGKYYPYYETVDALIGDKVCIGLLVRGRDPGKEAGNSLGTIMVGTPGSIMNAIFRDTSTQKSIQRIIFDDDLHTI